MRGLILITVPITVLSLLGCTKVQVPTERSEASIRGAEEVGAEAVPAARLHLQLAKEQTTTAKAMAAQGDQRALLVMARVLSSWGCCFCPLAIHVEIRTWEPHFAGEGGRVVPPSFAVPLEEQAEPFRLLPRSRRRTMQQLVDAINTQGVIWR